MAKLMKKVVLAGDPRVGKTSLVRRFVDQSFNENYISSVGVQVKRKRMPIDSGNELSMMIYDVLGQKDARESLQRAHFKGADGVLAVFDVKEFGTEKSIYDYWMPKINEVAGRVPVVIVANKVDLLNNYEPGRIPFLGHVLAPVRTELQKMGYASKVDYALTSAKTGENVEGAFKSLAKLLLEDKK